MKSIFGSHIDLEIDENFRKTKSDIDSKVEEIVKLINEDETDKIIIGNMKKEPIIEMIEDFQKKYHSLYARYDNLTGKIREQAQSYGNENEGSPSLSSSDSDPSKRNGDFQEIADLEEEISALFVKHQAYKIDVLRIVGSVTEKMVNRISSLETENKDLYQILEDTNREKANKLLEEDEFDKLMGKCKDGENTMSCKIKKLKSEVNNLKIQKGELKKQMAHKDEEASAKINHLQQESSIFLTKIQQIKMEKQILTQNRECMIEILQSNLREKIIAFDMLTEENKKVRRMFNECNEKLQSYFKLITEVIGKVGVTLVVLENVATRIFEKDLKNYENSISRIEKEVKDQDLLFKEMIGTLEHKALEEKAEEKLERVIEREG